VKKRAFAKVNLTLDVVRKREDGYHDLIMIMAPLQLHDLISLEIADKYDFTTNAKYLKKQENNSIYQTIEEMRKRYGFKENFKVDLQKYIPSQAGLGGGSSDAASTIILVEELLQLNLKKEEREDIASTIGKDVPFCLYNKTALVEGTGEKITFIDNNCDLNMLLVKPQQGVSTRQAYNKLHEFDIKHFDNSNMIKALQQKDYQAVVDNLANSFEEVAIELLPIIGRIKKEMLDFGFDGSLLCGSGSCVFAVSQDTQLLQAALKEFRKHYPFVWITNVKRSYNG